MSTYNPYRSPFLRKSLAERVGVDITIHPLERSAHEPYFKEKNPSGYQHDLGAQDLFLDDLGMLCREQFNGNHPLLERYLKHARWLRELWLLAGYQVIHQAPWWGRHFNIHSRRANAGEPRSITRFIGDRDLAKLSWDDLLGLVGLDRIPDKTVGYNPEGRWIGPEDVPLGRLRDFEWLIPKDEQRPNPVSDWLETLRKYADWDALDLVPDRAVGDRLPERELPTTPNFGGVILPSFGPSHVTELRILHPRESTPDLPARIGVDQRSRNAYQLLVLDQGLLGTCIAHAISVGLDLLAHRLSAKRRRFSRLWIHRAAGFSPGGGGTLAAAVDAIRTSLPCSEPAFPYPKVWDQASFASSTWRPETSEQLSDRRQLTAQLGVPLIDKIGRSDIARIKARLAAGWVVVVSTRLTSDFLNHGLRQIGVGLRPLPGQPYLQEGHAWLLVGYDHVDGRNDWKYQGRFLALNSWGRDFPTAMQPFGQGVVTLPFSMLLTEGVEAFALRLPSSA